MYVNYRLEDSNANHFLVWFAAAKSDEGRTR